MTTSQDHAVVLGAGMSGLFTARVLADHFRRVTVVERDASGTDGPRRGIPQGRHPHGLLLKASDLFDSLFPGIVAECAEHGAVRANVLTQHRVYIYGHQLKQTEIGRETVLLSRPLLEHRVAERVRALPNVSVRRGWEAMDPVTAAGRRVTGVTVGRSGASEREDLPADLVVDATGRSGRAQAWLRALGYPEPAEQRMHVAVSYATRLYDLPPDALGNDRLVSVGAEPGRPLGLAFVARENGQWSLTVYGYGPDRPTGDPERFAAIVEQLAPEYLLKVLPRATGVGDIHVMQYPAQVRRRYDSLDRFPEGFLVTGDAMCSVNPIYGSGMTSAATQARVLDEQLRGGVQGLWRRYFRAATRATAPAWWFATLGDAPLTGASGPRLPGVSLGAAYLRRLARVAESDAETSAALMRVAGMDRPPASLFRPRFLARAVRGGRTAP
ncbi:FAD-dependent monooxygenase [Streptomyces sp. LX-29]|uniref:NAD(P)/FAD-dependent oxidoreductase n=1 Tax=Streptomyces sp. LX-29 TaxID=2900152 RepID=UPI00240E852A|nr:FAD-dependent monooxygenase [Streptomyces sp. LX-29]WFB06018.1 FAD-dependent monooxygenase [Streptomyces sp. LX-29]